MALTTFAELKTSIANALNVPASSLTNIIDDIINVSERQIWRDLRLKEMEQSISATISSDVVSIPADFIDLKYAYYRDSASQDFSLKYRDAESLYDTGFSDGPRSKPDYIAIEGNNFIFAPLPDVGTYVLKGVYYRRLSQLNSTSVSDTIYQKYPEAYLYKSCALLERWLGREERVAVWDSLYRDLKIQLNQENKQGAGYAVSHY